MALPAERAKRLESLLEGVSRKDLAIRVEKQSATYRAGGTSAGIAGELDALAYAVARAPATFAAVRAALGRVMEAAPGFAPASLLDVGAGPGTASWAARDAWPGTQVTMLEPNSALRALAARLMPEANLIAGDLGGALPRADLVTASYVLAELKPSAAGEMAVKLWQAAGQALLLVEPGTPDGFARIHAARAALIEAGAHVAVPCTHDAACPMTGSDWCHFSVRVQRSRDHKIAKHADAPFEDERYAYVAVTRAAVARGARIVKPPVEAKPGITLPLCAADGLRNEFIPRRDKEAFRLARKLAWGDRF
jgi:ribosomal protein RSM22 (predicted rRNA methylase)